MWILIKYNAVLGTPISKAEMSSAQHYRDNKKTRKTVYSCPVPGCKYTTPYCKNNLRTHLFTHIPEKERPHQCPHEGCCRGFGQKEQLKGHLLLHSKQPLAVARLGSRAQVIQLKEGEGEKYITALKPHRSSIGKYVGVSLAANGKWKAQINVGGKNRYLGQFATAELAARVRDKIAIHFRGKNTTLNFPNSKTDK